MSIATSKSATYGHDTLPFPTARAIAAQLAQVVVHGGLHPNRQFPAPHRPR